jgi:hypothetical protein
MTRMEARDSQRVVEAIADFQRDPFHPGLNLEKLNASKNLHSIRASQSLRILLAKEGQTYVFLEAGQHDDIYARAARCRFVAGARSGVVGLIVIEPDADADDERPDRRARSRPSATPDRLPFDHWSDAELREAGFGDTHIAVVRLCPDEDHICEMDLPQELLERAIDILELTPEEWRSPSLDPEADAEQRLRQALATSPLTFTRLFTPEEAAEIVRAPIEDWMVFLHPDQSQAVERVHSGPARVRGSAGTGKTVVGLHRAASLARRYGDEPEQPPVLFTTFIKSLPPVFENLYRRLPSAPPEGVRFIHVDKLAREVCTEFGDRVAVDLNNVRWAAAKAYRDVVGTQSPLSTLSRAYLETEIAAVIKGRGISTLDEYLAIERTGRTTPFNEPMRRAMWSLREEYDRNLASRGTIDFADVVIRARDHARRRTSPMFRCAVIDEAQDLTLVGLQLIRALVNGSDGDRPDNLLIVGDGGQRVYPGGFTLRQAGIDVRGRTTVLKVNYRNTRQIIGAAMAVSGGQAINDLGDELNRGDADVDAGRLGSRPVLAVLDGHDVELSEIVRRIHDLAGTDSSVGLGDIVVAVTTNDQAATVMGVLKAADIECMRLEDYDGVPTDQVKVGTHHRVKGLEFKAVFLPFLGEADFPRRQANGQSAAEYDEQCTLAISCLYVAMTRARDSLVLTCSGDPAGVIAAGLDSFEMV